MAFKIMFSYLPMLHEDVNFAGLLSIASIVYITFSTNNSLK